jgi:AAA+ superfamily predicted ATPase
MTMHPAPPSRPVLADSKSATAPVPTGARPPQPPLSSGAPKPTAHAQPKPVTGPPQANARSEPAVAEHDELDLLIRARYAVLYVMSWEEARVEEHLARIAKARGKELHIWSVTGGMRRHGASNASRTHKGIADPLQALDTVMDHKEPAIYLFEDFHAFLSPTACNIAVVRKVREVARALADSYKTLVICAPLVSIAPELEKDVTVIDYTLPGAGEINSLLDKVQADVADHPTLKVDLDAASREAIIRAAGGLTLQEAENVFAKTLVNDGTLSGNDVSTVFAEKQQIVRKSGLLEYYGADSHLGDVGGLDHLKDWLRKRAAAFTRKAQDFGLPAPKGVLLVGVQGCGKSLCAKAVSREWNMPLLRFDVGRMFSSLVGSSESNVRRAIAVAESVSPAVLWVDEIDKAMSGSSSSGGSDGGTTARVMSTFLTWLSEKTKPVFVVATANDISALPPELLRKGRLDEIFFVDLPNPAERELIFGIHLSKRKRDPKGFDFAALVHASEGFSGAEIEQAIISALYDVFYSDRDLTTADLLVSLRETVPLSRTMSERIASLRAWADGRARPASPSGKSGSHLTRRKLEI